MKEGGGRKTTYFFSMNNIHFWIQFYPFSIMKMIKDSIFLREKRDKTNGNILMKYLPRLGEMGYRFSQTQNKWLTQWPGFNFLKKGALDNGV